jgi:hypothetical protein
LCTGGKAMQGKAQNKCHKKMLLNCVSYVHFLVRWLKPTFFICHMESPMIMWAGCAPGRGDFMCSFFIVFLLPRGMPMIICARVCGSPWAFHKKSNLVLEKCF